MIDRLRTGTLLRYAALAVPLAFVGLPIYVHIPKFYGQTRGMDLALLGAILLIVRLADCFLDPLIGWLRDRYPSARRAMMRVAVVGLMLGYWLVFTPPDGLSPWVQATALGGSLALVYFSFSVLMVHYYAAGVALATLAQDAPRVAAFRESFMLAGVLLASILPPLLAQHMAQQAYHILALIFAPMLLVGAFITMGLPPFAAQQTPAAPLGLGGIATCWRNDGIRRVLVILFFNSIPGAITGTLFLFFTADILGASDTQAGLFLMLYFVSAALAIPFWTWLARRIGIRPALAVGMGLAIVSFIFAYGLGHGEFLAFALICAVSGAAVGADLALLSAMFAQKLAGFPALSGMAFGLWHFISKLTLALAAGFVLPLLAVWGYRPGEADSMNILSLAYALVPCVLKCIAIGALLSIDRREKESTV
jgi:glycoside/pentoside/hexuronide:cation symporter, GPH family